MSLERWQQVKDLFAAALERGEDRDAWLGRACGEDAALRNEVQSLLAAHDGIGDFIAAPAADDALHIADGAATESAPWPGRVLGYYRIIEEIGRGGMSEVYRAVRDDREFEQQVAIKVLRRGYDIDSLTRRFRVERQILASLSHPNIAHLLDGGSTQEGLPYLVMEYVCGHPIDDWCEQRALDLVPTLRLFRTLCGAVQYVHRHLMVHGDLKCSNILVTDDGVVKLLDFGIARLLNPAPQFGGSDGNLTGLLALTPEYASPEQVRGQPITTASDVYSLGVVLYRVLTGRLPYRSRTSFPYELAAQICEHDPPRPSAVVHRWRRRLRGDLDAIVLKALCKDPEQRYASAEQFSQDVGRYLGGFPVMAGGTSLRHRAHKFVKRHSVAVAAGALFVISLIAGIVTTSWQAHVAMLERERAEQRSADVRRLAETFMFDVHDAIANLPGATAARQLLVGNSLKYLEALSKEQGTDPALQRDLAHVYERVGDVQGGFRSANMGDAAGALDSYRKALAIRSRLLAASPTDRDLSRELLRNYGKLSDLSFANDDMDAAIRYAQKTLPLARSLASDAGANADDRRNVANALLSLGWLQAHTAALDAGLESMRAAAALYGEIVSENPADARTRRNLAVAYGRLGEIFIGPAQRPHEAFAMHEKAFEIVAPMLREDERKADLQKMAAYALLGMGKALSKQGDREGALEKQQEASRRLQAMLDADPQNEQARYDTALAFSEMSDSLRALNNASGALLTLRDALSLLQPSTSTEAKGPELTDRQILIALDHVRMGETHAQMATQSGDTAAGRRLQLSHWRAARSWFASGASVLSAAEHDGALEGEALAKAQDALQGVSASDAAIASLQRVRLAHEE